MPPSASMVHGKRVIPPGPSAGMTEEERAKAEAQQRSFERSLAGPSVGKAGEPIYISTYMCL